jgi:PEP-CTERM motif
VLIQQANAGLTSEFDFAPLGTFDDRGNGTGTITNSHTNSIVLTEFVDTPFLIAAELGFDVSARPGMGEVQFADARYTLDVLTPGATLDSASGQSYTSVPEPGSFVMLIAGLCGLGLFVIPKGRSTVQAAAIEKVESFRNRETL